MLLASHEVFTILKYLGAIFFVAVLPQFIDASRVVIPQVLILGVTSVIIEFHTGRVRLFGCACIGGRS